MADSNPPRPWWWTIERPHRVTWKKRTNTGRVVYNRAKREFKFRDLYRIYKRLEEKAFVDYNHGWFLATGIEILEKMRSRGAFWTDFDPNALLPALNILTRELAEHLNEQGIPTNFPIYLARRRYRQDPHWPWDGNPLNP